MTIDVRPSAADVLLADGTIATVRPAAPADHDALVALHQGISDESVRLRFFGAGRKAGRTYAEHLADPGPGTIVLVAQAHGRLLGVASAEIDLGRPDTAEVAFVVAEDAHGHGVGTLLLEHLAAAARERRIHWFTADVLFENRSMLQVFADAGFPATRRTSEGVVTWRIATEPSPAGLAAADRREGIAERVSLRPLLYPTSVAVVGVSREGAGIGCAVLTSILRGGFTGDLWVVHPSAEPVLGVRTYPDLGAVPGHVDVLVVATPAAEVLEVVGEAARHGVSTVVVISSGFSELGAAGARMQRAVLRIGREHDMRILGPNCLGLLCNDPSVRLNATFSASVPGPGGLALGSQSGGVGFALLDLARGRGLGVHSFVSLGNQSDVSATDLLGAWMEDPRVSAGALYLEQLGQPRKLARVAGRFGRSKPLLAVVGGRSQDGAGAVVDALLAQAGVIPCRSAAELTGTADLLIGQPLPAGPRVGIVSNAGGIGLLAADAAAAAGLVVPELSQAAQDEIAGHVQHTIGVANPVDLGAGAGAEAVEGAVGALLATGEVDAVLVAVVATSLNDPRPAVIALDRVTRAAHEDGLEQPVLLVCLGGLAPDPTTVAGPTLFTDPEDAVQALAHAVRYAEWRDEPGRQWAEPDRIRAEQARDAAGELVGTGSPRWLGRGEADRLLAPYGIHRTDPSPVPPQRTGVELALGLSRHPDLGPVVTVAAGGVATDLLEDRAVVVPPVTRQDAFRALRSLRIWPTLDGRCGEPADVAALEDLVVALGQIAEDVPEVAELDLNPVVAGPDRAEVLDVQVRIAAVRDRSEPVPRQLTPAVEGENHG